jgi:hypothetical protein
MLANVLLVLLPALLAEALLALLERLPESLLRLLLARSLLLLPHPVLPAGLLAAFMTLALLLAVLTWLLLLSSHANFSFYRVGSARTAGRN